MAVPTGKTATAWRTIVLLLLLTFVPLIVTLISELNKTFLVWHIRIVDFLDMVLLAPFYLAILYFLRRTALSRQGHGWAGFLSFALVATFLYGHAMHLTANAVNTYSTEIHDYLDRIPADTYELLYFFDEELGHWIVFCSLFPLMGLWAWLERGQGQARLSGAQLACTLLAGIVEGIALGIALVEASQPVLGYVLSGLLLLWTALGAVGSVRWRHLGAELGPRPLTIYVLSVAVLVPVVETVYALVMGGFVEPSQLMLPR